MTDIDPTALRIEAGHLVKLTSECTCGGSPVEGGPQHEPGCGMEPLMTVAELAALVATPRVGDPDPTPGGDCPAWQGHYVCTWDAGHDGLHVAGSGEMIAAVWPVAGRGGFGGLVTAIWSGGGSR
jgi:hypothetical protein